MINIGFQLLNTVRDNIMHIQHCQTNHPNRQLINLNSKLTRRKGQRCSESNDSSGIVQNAWKKLMRTKKQIHVDLKTSSKSSSGKFFQPVSLNQSEVPN